MHRFNGVAADVPALSLSWPVQAPDGQVVSKHPFQVGERLTYEGSWLNIAAVTAVMKIAR